MKLTGFHVCGITLIGFALGCSAEGMSNDEGGEVSADDAVELGSLEQRLVNTWIGPVSEEVGYNAATCAQANVGVQQADCTGQYCDNNYLYCAALPAGRTTIGSGFWTAYISEKNPNNNIYCQTGGVGTPINGIVDGIRATGQYSDNISLHCREMNQAPVSCTWTGWFSEENSAMNFGAGWYATGVKCSGQYCDNLSYYICTF